jgi:Holliday junction resolvasome RuvABC endonuclease subunit
MNLIGVDLGTHKVALAVFVEDTMVAAYAHESPSDLSRDLQLLELSSFTHDVGLSVGVDSVWIEDTIIGNNRKYSIQLSEAKGALLADLARLRLELGTDVRLVDNKTWKREVVGNGNASKDQVRDYIRVTHPAYAAFCGDDQDCYDAACIGLYGFTILERSTHLQL